MKPEDTLYVKMTILRLALIDLLYQVAKASGIQRLVDWLNRILRSR